MKTEGSLIQHRETSWNLYAKAILGRKVPCILKSDPLPLPPYSYFV